MMPRDCYVLARQQGQYLNGHRHEAEIDAMIGTAYIIASAAEGAQQARIGDTTVYDRGDDTYLVTHRNKHRRLVVDVGSTDALHELLGVIQSM